MNHGHELQPFVCGIVDGIMKFPRTGVDPACRLILSTAMMRYVDDFDRKWQKSVVFATGLRDDPNELGFLLMW